MDGNDYLFILIAYIAAAAIMLLGMNQLGYLSAHTFLMALVSVIPVLITVSLASWVRNRLSGTLFRRLVLCFLLIMGLILMGRIFL